MNELEMKLRAVAEWIANTRDWTRDEVFSHMMQDDFDVWAELDIAAKVVWEAGALEDEIV